VRYGGDFELSDEKKRVLQEAEDYIDNHMGYRYLNRSRTEELFEQQLTKIMHEKENALKDTPPEELEKIEKLKSHIEQLQKAYQSVLPKMPTSWDDLKEKDDDE
jgi:superfamily I DNA/RNA helicase